MRRILLLAAVAACGAPPPATVPGATLAGAPTAAGETALAIPEPLLGIPLIVRGVAGVPLFADEQRDAAAILAAWAKAAGLTVEDPARTREMLARAANGQHALTGKACGSPLWELAALERWRAELDVDGRIEATIACTAPGACRLVLRISEGLDAAARDAGRTAEWTAPWTPSVPWREQLPRRLRELAGAPATPTAAALATADAEERLPDAAPAQACLGDAGAIGLLIETDASGAIARCEGSGRRIVADAPIAACACKALVGTSAGGGARRFSTVIASAARTASVTTRSGKVIEAVIEPTRKRDAGTGLSLPVASHRSVRDWEPPPPWTIAPCFRDLADRAQPLHARLTVTVGETAAPKLAVFGALTPAQATCLATVVARASKIPCPDPGTHTMLADLLVGLRAP